MPILDFKLLASGYCTQSSYFVFPKEAKYQMSFYATYALIKHSEQGYILFDTGYSSYIEEAAKNFPYLIYTKLTPIYFNKEESAAKQIAAMGIKPDDISLIIISHFHADHIGGLRDFPKAKFICFENAYQDVKNRSGIPALKRAFLPQLMPKDFEDRCMMLNIFKTLSKEYAPFTEAVDILGDNSLLAVHLPGHAVGQMGLFFKTKGKQYFLIADAAWHSRALKEWLLPHSSIRLFIDSWQDYVNSFRAISEFWQCRPEVEVIATHCQEIYQNHILDKEIK